MGKVILPEQSDFYTHSEEGGWDEIFAILSMPFYKVWKPLP
jgi:hypothetical protein